MSLPLDTIAIAAQRIGLSTEDLAAVVQLGGDAAYHAGDYLFHESTPREWLGIVLEGEVEIERGAQARTVTLATLLPGAVFSEGVMLDHSPHASSAVTRQGARVWKISRAALERVRAEKPDVFYRIVGNIAMRLGGWLDVRKRMFARRQQTTLLHPVGLRSFAKLPRRAGGVVCGPYAGASIRRSTFSVMRWTRASGPFGSV